MHDPGFSKDFEIRKVIFGLTAIINAPQDSLPAMLNEKLPLIMNNLAFFAIKIHHIRLKDL